MSRNPWLPTNIAKLVPTPASHVVAALVLLNYKFALLALPIMQVALEKDDLVGVTLSIVNRK